MAPVSLGPSGCSNMRFGMRFFRLPIWVFLAVVFVLAAFASQAARFLVVDQPQKSDVIVVLAGETNARPARALDLLRQGVAPRVFLNAQANNQIYDQQLIGIAQKYVDTIGEASRVSVCPVYGLSTVAEADDVRRCLQSIGAHRVLIVTSEFHTRRSLMILRHRLPQYEFNIAAARDPAHFGESWWTNREWAKVTLDEWLKMFWWELVDRWK
jgi:uncharacterized SAM-binding protein YcdF (DUF218 family)